MSQVSLKSIRTVTKQPSVVQIVNKLIETPKKQGSLIQLLNKKSDTSDIDKLRERINNLTDRLPKQKYQTILKPPTSAKK